jgi:hypothetical protein
VKCLYIQNLRANLRSSPPSLSTACTKQWWRSGVQRSLGIFDRTQGLTMADDLKPISWKLTPTDRLSVVLMITRVKRRWWRPFIWRALYFNSLHCLWDSSKRKIEKSGLVYAIQKRINNRETICIILSLCAAFFLLGHFSHPGVSITERKNWARNFRDLG